MADQGVATGDEAAGLLAGCTGGANIPGISGFGSKPEPVAETPA